MQNETKDTAGIPGADVLGHGTQVAAIACGSSGVAAQADILVVKLGLAAKNGFPRTTQLMEALDYVVRKAIDYGKPLAVNISFGNNYGDHTGSSLLENFINDIADSWKCSICIGSGNEGLGAVHTGGTLTEDTEETVELAVSSYETGLSIQIWKDYWDDIAEIWGGFRRTAVSAGSVMKIWNCLHILENLRRLGFVRKFILI